MTLVALAWDVRLESGSEVLPEKLQVRHQILHAEEKPNPPKISVQVTAEPAEPVSFPKVVYIVELPETQYRLKRPVVVFLEQGEEGWLASRDDLGICCYGADIEEALSNFVSALLDDYDAYASVSIDELTEGARKLAAQLREVIERL